MRSGKLVAVLSLYFLSLLLFSISAWAVMPNQAVLTDARFIQAVQHQEIQTMNEIMAGKSNDRAWHLTWEHYYSPTSSTEWDNDQRYHYTYLNGNYPQEILGEINNNGTWTNYTRNTYTYNDDYSIATYIMENWENDAWVYYMKLTYTFEQENYSQLVGQYWTEDAWKNLYRVNYTYNANNQLETTVSQAWPMDSWVNSSKSVFSYNTNNLISERKNYMYGGGWLLGAHTLYTYTDFLETESSLYQTWSIANNVYTDNSRSTYTYNGLQQNINILNETYQNNAWNNQSQTNMAYDANSNQSENINQLWNSTSWDNNRKIVSEYEQYTSANEDNTLPLCNLTLTAGPNPFAQNTTINIKSEIAGKAALNIYNLKGQLVKTTSLNLSKDKTMNWQWNEKTSAGIYFVEVRQNNQVIKSMKLVRY